MYLKKEQKEHKEIHRKTLGFEYKNDNFFCSFVCWLACLFTVHVQIVEIFGFVV